MTLVGYGVSALNGQVFRYLYSICYVISQLIYFLFFFFFQLSLYWAGFGSMLEVISCPGEGR